MTTSHPTLTTVPRRLTDESAVRLGLGGFALLVLVAALETLGVPTTWAVAVLLLAGVRLAAPLEPSHAWFIGVTGGALADGFLLHQYGELGVGAVDIGLLAGFVVAALMSSVVRRSTP